MTYGCQEHSDPFVPPCGTLLHSVTLLTGLKAGAENGCQPAQARLKSWRRTVKLDRTTNVIEINDSYFLTEPVSDITLNLMTACKVEGAEKAG